MYTHYIVKKYAFASISRDRVQTREWNMVILAQGTYSFHKTELEKMYLARICRNKHVAHVILWCHIYFYIHKALKGYDSPYLLSRRSSSNFRKVRFLRDLRLSWNYFGEINFALSTVFFYYKPCQKTLRSVLYMRHQHQFAGSSSFTNLVTLRYKRSKITNSINNLS